MKNESSFFPIGQLRINKIANFLRISHLFTSNLKVRYPGASSLFILLFAYTIICWL